MKTDTIRITDWKIDPNTRERVLVERIEPKSCLNDGDRLKLVLDILSRCILRSMPMN